MVAEKKCIIISKHVFVCPYFDILNLLFMNVEHELGISNLEIVEEEMH